MTISMLGTTTNGEPEAYRRQGNIFVCVQDTTFTVWSVVSVSEPESQPTERLSDVLLNQQSHQVLYRTTCCVGCGRSSIRFSTTALRTYRVGVRKMRCVEAVWRLSATTVSPAYRIGLRERRRGENVYTRPSSPLDSQTVGSCR